MAAYLIAHVEITDAAAYAAYERSFFPTLKPFGGRMLVAEQAPDVLEGEWPLGRTVIIEFDSEESASAWYHSPAYQEILPHRQANSTGTVAIVRQFELPRA